MSGSVIIAPRIATIAIWNGSRPTAQGAEEISRIVVPTHTAVGHRRAGCRNRRSHRLGPRSSSSRSRVCSTISAAHPATALSAVQARSTPGEMSVERASSPANAGMGRYPQCSDT